MDANARQRILEELEFAAKSAFETEGAKAWNHGWAYEEYRHSDSPVFRTPNGWVGFTADGITSLEKAVNHLSASANIRRIWDIEDLWPICVDAVATLPKTEKLMDILGQRLHQLESPKKTLVATALANVGWETDPLVIANLVIGHVDDRWRALVADLTKGKVQIPDPSKEIWWLADDAGELVALATHVAEQLGKAVSVAERRFEAVVDAALLSALDPDGLGLFSGRGGSHKPGVRGIILDRSALRKIADENPRLSRELASFTHLESGFGLSPSFRWFAEQPFPLDKLLSTHQVKARAERAATATDTAWARIATAGFWHAKSFWADDPNDAVLACGIAFDALLAERGGSPGRVLAERFALLEPERPKRRERMKHFGQVYAYRNAVAHGAQRSDTSLKVRSIEADVRWAADRLMDLIEKRAVSSEDDMTELFESLKWG